ncbi:SDR family oxidoreductase [Stomatohabitans albus]|uniref:SDR family oxidoreductase n=1 Tax=Stomatohabitans albus TaxID=3110766 RepID=UPI00300CA1F8
MNIKVIGVEHDSGAKLVRMLTSKHEVGVILCATPLFDLAGQQPLRMSPDQWLGAGASSCVTLSLTDQAALAQSFTGVDALAIMLGRPSTDPAPYVGAMATIIAAAHNRVKRFVMLSDLGASDPQDNEWLQALARVEGMVASTGMDTTVIRTALTLDDSDPLTRLIAAGQVRDLGGTHYPITSGDVAGAVWMALHDRPHLGRTQVIGLAGDTPVATGDLHTILPPTTQPGPGVNLPPSVADWFNRTHTPPPGSVIVH